MRVPVLAVFFLVFLAAACAGGSGSGGPHGHRLMPEEFLSFATLTPEEIRHLGQQLALLNDPDRNRQRQALERIHRFGLRAVPVLLDTLERGHAGTQQGGLEVLRQWKNEQTRRRSTGEEVPNGPILAAWYLVELERGYQDLLPPLDITAGGGREDSPAVRRRNREVYRQQLCELYAEVGRPDMTDRFLDALAADESELVRAAGFHACARLATGAHLPRLVGLYADSSGLPRQFLWRTLRELTGRNYPDDPRIWQAWLNKKGTP